MAAVGVQGWCNSQREVKLGCRNWQS